MSAKVCLDKEVDEWHEIPCDEEDIVQVVVEDVTIVEAEDVTALEAPRRILFDMFAYQFEEAHDS